MDTAEFVAMRKRWREQEAERERMMREHAEFYAGVAAAERKGIRALCDFLDEQAAVPEAEKPKRPLSPMEQKLADMRRLDELCAKLPSA
jgi:hypothetical protein